MKNAFYSLDPLNTGLIDMLLGEQDKGYPPHNIIQEDRDNYTIQLAVAGFDRSELDITVQKKNLTVKSNKIVDSTTRTYLHKGIAARNFTKNFLLNGEFEVSGADLVNGLLEIHLIRIVPETEKPINIKIS